MGDIQETQALLQAHGINPPDNMSYESFIANLAPKEMNDLVKMRREELVRQSALNLRGKTKPEEYIIKQYSPEAQIVDYVGVLTREMHFEAIYEPEIISDNNPENSEEITEFHGPTFDNPKGVVMADQWIRRTISLKLFTNYNMACRYALMWRTRAWTVTIQILLKQLEQIDYIASEDGNARLLGWNETMIASNALTNGVLQEVRLLKNVRIKEWIQPEGTLIDQLPQLFTWEATRGLMRVPSAFRVEALMNIAKAYTDIHLAQNETRDIRAVVWRVMLREFLKTFLLGSEHDKRLEAYRESLNVYQKWDQSVIADYYEDNEKNFIWDRIRDACTDANDLETFRPETFIDTFELTEIQKKLLKLRR